MNNRAESDRVAHPLFQEGGGGSTPTSALHLQVFQISVIRACELNAKWHSRLPLIKPSNVYRNKHRACFAAESSGVIYAVAIWTSPVARMLNDGKTIELRRFAIAPDAPRNTGSRMLAVMRRILCALFPGLEIAVSYQDTVAHAGTIYAAAGWVRSGDVRGRQWSCPSRPRDATQTSANKVRWQVALNANTTRKK